RGSHRNRPKTRWGQSKIILDPPKTLSIYKAMNKYPTYSPLPEPTSQVIAQNGPGESFTIVNKNEGTCWHSGEQLLGDPQKQLIFDGEGFYLTVGDDRLSI